MSITNCKYCNKELEQNANGTKEFCNGTCSKAFSRKGVKSDIAKSDKTISDTSSVIKSDTPVITKFVNHITGDEHEITEVSKRTGLNYDLNQKSEKLGLKKFRCSGCGEPTWYGCAECGKNGGQTDI